MKLTLTWLLAPPSPFDPDVLIHFAREADRLGFDAIETPEHVAFPVGFHSKYPYTPDGSFPAQTDEFPIPDPLLPLAYVASATSHIKFGTYVIILPQHHPLYLAKQMATLDVLSKGRTFIGIGSGWLKEEFEALGIDFHQRGARTDEAIQAMRVLWRENPSTFKGKHFNFGPLKSFPKPVQKNGIPILVGGISTPAVRRAARYGDGFLAVPGGAGIAELIKQLREECGRIGRTFAEIELSGQCRPTYDGVRRLQDLGVQRAHTLIPVTANLDEITRNLERVANDVLVKL
ncbi:MAG: LLM class F420-dependent oxidoreductase [Candidatus Binataceae bacterium]